MKLFDSHCHLDFAALAAQCEAVLERARAAGVAALLVPGVSPRQWSTLHQVGPRQAAEAAGVQLLHAVGIHPAYLASLDAAELERALTELGEVAQRSGAVAIGECGLHKGAGLQAAPDVQRRCLRRQLAVAENVRLPVILHIVGAHADALDVLRAAVPAQGGVVHAYSGSAELVTDYAALGLYFGVGPVITRPGARRLQAAVRAMPLDRIVIETDAPDQALWGAARGSGEPAALEGVARELARTLGRSCEEIAEITWENAVRLYQLGGATAG